MPWVFADNPRPCAFPWSSEGHASAMKAIFARPLAAIAFACTLAACAAPSSTTSTLGYKERAVTRSEDLLRVSAAALSWDESTAVYGVALASEGVQPVWIEVENKS